MPGVRVKFVHSQVERMKQAGLYGQACRMSRAGKVSKEQLAENPVHFVYLARSSRTTAELLKRLPMDPRPAIAWSLWSGYLKKPSVFVQYCQEHDLQIIPIHSGGHAHPEDLAELVKRMKPRVVVPIHTEAASRFSDIMPNVRVLRDGAMTSVASLL